MATPRIEDRGLRSQKPHDCEYLEAECLGPLGAAWGLSKRTRKLERRMKHGPNTDRTFCPCWLPCSTPWLDLGTLLRHAISRRRPHFPADFVAAAGYVEGQHVA